MLTTLVILAALGQQPGDRTMVPHHRRGSKKLSISGTSATWWRNGIAAHRRDIARAEERSGRGPARPRPGTIRERVQGDAAVPAGGAARSPADERYRAHLRCIGWRRPSRPQPPQHSRMPRRTSGKCGNRGDHLQGKDDVYCSKLELTPDEIFLQDALRSGRAIKTEISMKLGEPDLSLQARENHLDMTHVHRLSAILESQGLSSPVIVFRDKKGRLWLADGFHRHECYKKASKEAIPAYQIEGEKLEAIEYATMCNRHTCLGKTRDDIRKAIRMLLATPEWFDRSDSWIASKVGSTTETMVYGLRRRFCEETGCALPTSVWLPNGSQMFYVREDGFREFRAYPTNDGKFKIHLTGGIGGRGIIVGNTPQEAARKLANECKHIGRKLIEIHHLSNLRRMLSNLRRT